MSNARKMEKDILFKSAFRCNIPYVEVEEEEMANNLTENTHVSISLKHRFWIS